MSLRLPDLKAQASVLDPLGVEILGEKAASLGRAGEKVERAIAALESHVGDHEARRRFVSQAADAVYAYFVQRELCGFRRHHDAIADYRIPREVLARLGAR
ncbi:hypothetical protein EJC49_02280 [Aquibium carbonis]|uniref:Uncharacterized protein n=1 Tax=Aquibium carbonis TaxID=2495581 RepID=A0A3R9YVA5_9HYPH|nr:DUF6665 family protein [Aquibium carbonis]RST87988.1 hypothetical protein EJC49_02280 [Aquibium carbonis]